MESQKLANNLKNVQDYLRNNKQNCQKKFFNIISAEKTVDEFNSRLDTDEVKINELEDKSKNNIVQHTEKRQQKIRMNTEDELKRSNICLIRASERRNMKEG